MWKGLLLREWEANGKARLQLVAAESAIAIVEFASTVVVYPFRNQCKTGLTGNASVSNRDLHPSGHYPVGIMR